MEHATHQSAAAARLPLGIQFNPRSTLSAHMPSAGHLVLGGFQSDVPSMVGTIRVNDTRDPNAWERHDHGDEVLVLLSGTCTMTLRDAQGRTTEHSMSSGDVLIIPKGVAHHAALLTDEIQVLFITPRTGSKDWVETTQTQEAEQ